MEIHADSFLFPCTEVKSGELKSSDNGEGQTYAPQVNDPPVDPELPPLTATTERKLMAKIDWHILPCLCVLYLLAFLDR